MSTTQTQSRDHQRSYSPGAVGVTVFAAVLMMIGGGLHAFQGFVALVNDEFYVVINEDYAFEFDLTSWGWIHLIFGIVVLLAGLSLLQGATWARVVAVILASLSIIANFLWMPHYPLWSLTVIALDVLVIWAVTAHGRDIRVS